MRPQDLSSEDREIIAYLVMQFLAMGRIDTKRAAHYRSDRYERAKYLWDQYQDQIAQYAVAAAARDVANGFRQFFRDLSGETIGKLR